MYLITTATCVFICIFAQCSGEEMIRDSDMLLTVHQFKQMTPSEGNTNKQRPQVQKRKATGDYWATLWPNKTVRYGMIPRTYTQEQKNIITWAMSKWSKETCIVFKSAVNDLSKHFVLIRANAKGCFSNVGYLGNKIRPQLYGYSFQHLNLNPDYLCVNKRVVLHEIGHTLGLIHEHSRPDRDENIRLLRENIRPEKLSQLRRMANGETFGLPYDFQSIMHYSPRYFAKNNKFSFETRDKSRMKDTYEDDARQLSFTDVAAINIMYKCGAHCSNVQCAKPGFLNKHCQCVTPWGFAARKCLNTEGDNYCRTKYGSKRKCYRMYTVRNYDKIVRLPHAPTVRKCRKFCGKCYRYIPSEWSSFPNAPKTTGAPLPSPTKPVLSITTPKPVISITTAQSTQSCRNVFIKATCENYASNSRNWCVVNENFMKKYCSKTCYKKYRFTSPDVAKKFCKLQIVVITTPKPAISLPENCQDRYTGSTCKLLARNGRDFCASSYRYMRTYCQKTCFLKYKNINPSLAMRYCALIVEPTREAIKNNTKISQITRPTMSSFIPPANCRNRYDTGFCTLLSSSPRNYCKTKPYRMKRYCKRTCYNKYARVSKSKAARFCKQEILPQDCKDIFGRSCMHRSLRQDCIKKEILMKQFCRRTCYMRYRITNPRISRRYCRSNSSPDAGAENTCSNKLSTIACKVFSNPPDDWCFNQKSFMKRACRKTCFDKHAALPEVKSYYCKFNTGNNTIITESTPSPTVSSLTATIQSPRNCINIFNTATCERLRKSPKYWCKNKPAFMKLMCKRTCNNYGPSNIQWC